MVRSQRNHVATSGVAVGDVVQLRLLLETWAVREAAEKPDAAVLADAAVLLDRMDAEPDPDRFLDLDGDFHAGLVGLAGNVLVTAVITSVRGRCGPTSAVVPMAGRWFVGAAVGS